MPWAVAGAGISAGAGLLGGMMQSNAASKAAADAQKRFEQQRQDLAPYREAGLAPLQAQTDLLGLSGQPAADAAMARFQQSPGYQFQFEQGLRATDARQAAMGIGRSGATIKAEETFGQGLANQDFTNYYNRLMGLTTLGANAAAGGAQTANAAGVAAQQAGNTQASIYGNTASGLGGTINNLFSDKNFQSWAGGLFGSAPTTASVPMSPNFASNLSV